MEPQYNMSDYTGKMTTQLVTVKNYPWYDGWKRGPNNADGTMGDLILDDDGIKYLLQKIGITIQSCKMRMEIFYTT